MLIKVIPPTSSNSGRVGEKKTVEYGGCLEPTLEFVAVFRQDFLY